MVGGRKKRSVCMSSHRKRAFVCLLNDKNLSHRKKYMSVCLFPNRKKTFSLCLSHRKKKKTSLFLSLSSPNRSCGFIGLAGGTFRNRRGNSPWRCRPGCRWRRRRRGSSWWPTNCCRSWRRTQPRGRSCRGAACLCIPYKD